jgi:hypothetical protein
MHDEGDPFALSSDARVTAGDGPIRGGRYRLPQRDGTHKKGGWQRVSNLVAAYSDQFGLRMWEIGEVLQGVAMAPELYAQLLAAKLHEMEKPVRKEWVKGFIEHAKEASGGNAGSNHGSMRHESVEGLHAGLGYAHRDAGTRRALSLYADALRRNRLRAMPGMQERIVLIPELEACGTLDNILEEQCWDCLQQRVDDCPSCFNVGWTNPTVGDLKTQRRFWTWLEIKAQQACYAHGVAMWNPALGTWGPMPPVSQDVAYVLHMPRDPDPGTEEAKTWEPRVDVWEVDIREGWQTAKRAREVVLDRKKAKSVEPGAWLRPAPEPTETERYAARFAAVGTLAEGSTLVQECIKKGIYGPELVQCAKLAYARIAVPA